MWSYAVISTTDLCGSSVRTKNSSDEWYANMNPHAVGDSGPNKQEAQLLL